MKRRQFIKSCLTYSGALGLVTLPASRALSAPSFEGRTVILIELNGGNDGLNTVIPFAEPVYYALRPNIAIPRDRVMQLDETLGLHPALAPMMPHWQRKDMAIALGVGYPNPNLSHFRSIDIWDQASESDEVLDNGWISHAFEEHQPPADAVADGIILGRNNFGPLAGNHIRSVSLRTPSQLKSGLRLSSGSEAATQQVARTNPALRHVLETTGNLKQSAEAIMARQLESIDPGGSFPDDAFGKQMQLAAQLILSNSQVPAIKTSIGSFDTHSNQAGQHHRLLSQLAHGIAAFAAAMKNRGIWDQVLIMTYSEFGRRPKENNSRGTDHGTAAPHFLLGGRIRGGFYGQQPSLEALDDANLVYGLHFKRLYASIAKEWWGLEANFLDHPPLNCIS